MKQLFHEQVEKTLDRCRAIHVERGAQYGDTWRSCQFLALKSVLDSIHIHGVDDRALRAIAAATFVDIKYARLLGGFRDDHLIDGINYTAMLAETMLEIQGKK